jgi:hypothetical protein
MNLADTTPWYIGAVFLLVASAQAQTPTPTATPGGTPGSTAQKPTLEKSVTLAGANQTNNALSMAARTGAPVSLTLIVKEPPQAHPKGVLRVLVFSSQGEATTVATARIRIGASTAPATESAAVMLDKPAEIPFSLEFDRLSPGKTYKGQLVLTSADLLHQWEITLTTEGRGIVAVDPVGTLKFVRWPYCCTGSFSFTLYDKTGAGPYHHVHVRLEPAAAANSKTLSSNFTLDTFSFSAGGNTIDLERREGGSAPGQSVLLEKAQTFTAHIGALSPGEYSGALHFGADEASDDAAEAKLPLVIQVRHHWLLPVFVILIGSAFGWFGSKFLVGARRARELARQIRELRVLVDSLARRSNPSEGWQFPSEAASLGFARVDVELSRLLKLTASTVEVVFRGDAIEQRLKQSEQRLLGLESLHETRLRVQPCATDRPAAQRAIGTRLRSATDLLDRPTFGASEQASLKQLFDDLGAWAKKDGFASAYQQALVERLRGGECPTAGQVATVVEEDVRTELSKRMGQLPKETEITAETDVAKLTDFDQAITRVILLWRESSRSWAKALAQTSAAGASLTYLFKQVDTQFWNELKTAANDLELNREARTDEPVQTYEIVETNLVSNSSKFTPWQIRRHPLNIHWQVVPPRGEKRATETDGLTLVQYFPSPGRVTITANLQWNGAVIPVKQLSFEVVPNPEYAKRVLLAKEWTEYAAIGLAALFATITALATQYDSTFGSFTQYMAIFIWAAGAAAGGNLFSQLGTTSTPGGATATLKA